MYAQREFNTPYLSKTLTISPKLRRAYGIKRTLAAERDTAAKVIRGARKKYRQHIEWTEEALKEGKITKERFDKAVQRHKNQLENSINVAKEDVEKAEYQKVTKKRSKRFWKNLKKDAAKNNNYD